MKIEYLGQEYELVQLSEVEDIFKSYDIIGIFKMEYVTYQNHYREVLSFDEWEDLINNQKSCDAYIDWVFVNYFYGATDGKEQIEENAHYFIDRYLKKIEGQTSTDQLLKLAKNFKKAWRYCESEKVQEEERKLLDYIIKNL